MDRLAGEAPRGSVIIPTDNCARCVVVMGTFVVGRGRLAARGHVAA